jgi:hypothetical protein
MQYDVHDFQHNYADIILWPAAISAVAMAAVIRVAFQVRGPVSSTK